LSHFPQRGKKNDFTSVLIWRATYNDGTQVWEREANGKENKIGDLLMDEVKHFDLLKPAKKAEDFIDYEVEYPIKSKRGDPMMVRFRMLNKEMQPTYRLSLSKGQRLIFARRTKVQQGQRVAIFGKDTQVAFPAKPAGKIILIGWQKTIGGENTQAINYIFPDGTIELAGEWGTDADHLKASEIVTP